MFDHIAIPVRDMERSRRFYEQALKPLGGRVLMEWDDGVAFGDTDTVFEGELLALRPRAEVVPVHVAFRTDRSGVDAFYEAALAAGATDNGPPGVREHYHQTYYAAFVTDPDGHNIEAVCHSAA